MPELPEVETIRRALTPLLTGKRIIEASLIRRDVLVMPGDPHGGFSRQRSGKKASPAAVTSSDLLEGSIIVELRRQGKQLAIIGKPKVLVVQLGMSGQLLIQSGRKEQSTGSPSHAHARWILDDGSELLFRDPRRFGGLRCFPDVDALSAHWSELGPDGLGVGADELHEALNGTTRGIKAALLDQTVVAGVGNIYADESLFISGISPVRRADTLRPEETHRLAAAIRQVLAEAVQAGGSTLRDYVTPGGDAGAYQVQHRVYGRGGKPCSVCGKTLKTATAAGRTTVWCPSCQPTRRKQNKTN